jgi:hypothetical protein
MRLPHPLPIRPLVLVQHAILVNQSSLSLLHLHLHEEAPIPAGYAPMTILPILPIRCIAGFGGRTHYGALGGETCVVCGFFLRDTGALLSG